MAETPFTLTDLIDFEVQLARDGKLDLHELAERDQRLALDRLSPLQKPQSLLHVWLTKLRTENEAELWPGQSWQASLTLLAWLFTGAGLLSGWASMQAFLRYDGSRPINIIPFIGFYAGLQLFLLIVWFFKKTLLQVLARAHSVKSSSWLQQRLVAWLERRMLRSARSGSDAILLNSLRRFHRLHGELVQLKIEGLLQSFGLSFFIASLLTLLYLVSFHDLAFAWSTTLELSPAHFQTWMQRLALPFAWLDGQLVPSAETIAATHYVRLEDRYLGSSFGHRAVALEFTRAWWPFLALCVVSYGLLPRFLMWLWVQRSIGLYLDRLHFKDQASSSLLQRLHGARVSWETPLARQSHSGSERPAASKTLALRDEVKTCIVVKWFDAPFTEPQISQLLKQYCDWTIEACLASSGTEQENAAIIRTLKAPPTQPGPRVTVTVHDPWELPGEAFASFIEVLHREIGRDHRLLCAPAIETQGLLQEPPAAELALWRRSLADFNDPFVGLLFEQGGRS